MKEYMDLPSFLPYIDASNVVSRLEIRLISIDPSAMAETSFPFFLISDSDALTRLVGARFKTDSESGIKDVFLLLQRDNDFLLRNQVTPITNPEIEDLWQKTFDYHSRRRNGSSLMTFSRQVDPEGRLVPFQPLFFCKARNHFFLPPCPKCGCPLQQCRDDATLNSLGLRTFSGSSIRYLFCPPCLSTSLHTELYAYEVGSFDPPIVKDRFYLIRQFGNLVKERDGASQIPCVDCPQNDECYGPEDSVSSNIVPFSFYPFFVLIFDSMSLSAHDFMALVSGASFEELEAHLKMQGEAGRVRHLKNLPIRGHTTQTPFLFSENSRFFLEVLYLKLSFLGQVIQSAFEGPPGSSSHPTLSLDGIWVKLSDKSPLLPYYWTFALEQINLLRAPLDMRVRPQLPIAYSFHYLAVIWFQTLLVNGKQDGSMVCEAVERIYGQTVLQGSVAPSQDQMNHVGSAFSPENVFWNPKGLSISDHWQNLWNKSLGLGWFLFTAALRGDAQWPVFSFQEQLEDLREEVRKELFAARTEAHWGNLPVEDAAIFGILTRLIEKWENEAGRLKQETSTIRGRNGEEELQRKAIAPVSPYSEEETLPLGFKMESDEDSISETIVVSPEESRRETSRSKAPSQEERLDRASGEEAGLSSDSLQDRVEEEIPETIIISPKKPGGAQGVPPAPDRPQHERETYIPETVIISPRKAGEALSSVPRSAAEAPHKGSTEEGEAQSTPKSVESVTNYNDRNQSAGEEIPETIILSPHKDRPGLSSTQFTHPTVQDHEPDAPDADKDLEMEEKHGDISEEELMSETIVLTPKKDKDKDKK